MANSKLRGERHGTSEVLSNFHSANRLAILSRTGSTICRPSQFKLDISESVRRRALRSLKIFEGRSGRAPRLRPGVPSTASRYHEASSLLSSSFTQDGTHRPVVCSTHSGYLAPSILMFEEALSMARRSSGVRSTFAAPRFSSRRCSLVVPGIGTIHDFLASNQASAS